MARMSLNWKGGKYSMCKKGGYSKCIYTKMIYPCIYEEKEPQRSASQSEDQPSRGSRGL